MNNFSLIKKTIAAICMVTIGMFAVANASDDTALVTKISGTVTVKDTGETILPFSKLRYQDVLRVSIKSSIELVYFDSGRHETWKGSSEFRVGSEKSEALVGEPEKVSKVSAKLARRLAKTPSSGKGRVGMVRLRNVDPIKMKEIERNYLAYKQQYNDSYFPQLYKLNALYSMRAFDAMEDFLNELETTNQAKSDLLSKYRQDIAVGRAEQKK